MICDVAALLGEDRILRMSLGARSALALSDIHLRSPFGEPDPERDADLARVVRRAARLGWLVILNGDIFDWAACRLPPIEVLRRHHPRLLRAFRFASRHIDVVFVQGNHDPPIELLPRELGWLPCRGLVLDGSIFVFHGDILDDALAGKPRGVVERRYAIFEWIVGTPMALPVARHDSLRNRFYVWVTLTIMWYALHVARRVGWTGIAGRITRLTSYLLRMETLRDPAGVVANLTAARLPQGVKTVVLGHTHHPGVVGLPNTIRYVNCGTWSSDHATVVRLRRGQVDVVDVRTGATHGDEGYRGWWEPADWVAWWPVEGRYLHLKGFIKTAAGRMVGALRRSAGAT